MVEYYFIENYLPRKELIMGRIVKTRGKSKVKTVKTVKEIEASKGVKKIALAA
ncbi:MAG: hypothetical protein ACUZ77_12720 [Candidatus Brocadiales bacterium]